MQNANKRTGYCQKVKFRNSPEAKAAMRRFNAEKKLNGDRNKLKSVYRCSECQAWHLTSMSQKLASIINSQKESREKLIHPKPQTVYNRLQYLLKKNRLNDK